MSVKLLCSLCNRERNDEGHVPQHSGDWHPFVAPLSPTTAGETPDSQISHSDPGKSKSEAEVERLRAAPLPLNSREAVFTAADERFHQLSEECLADDTSSQDFFRNGYADGVNDVGQRLRAVATRHNLILDDKIDIVQVVVDELDILHGDSTTRVPRTPYEVLQAEDRQYWADKAVGAMRQLAAERARKDKPAPPHEAETPTRKEGHSALRGVNGKLEKFDPNPPEVE